MSKVKHILTHSHTLTHSLTHARARTHTHTHTHTHTLTHTHTHSLTHERNAAIIPSQTDLLEFIDLVKEGLVDADIQDTQTDTDGDMGGFTDPKFYS